MQRLALDRHRLRLRGARAPDKRRIETPKDWQDELWEIHKALVGGAAAGKTISKICSEVFSAALLKWAVVAIVLLKLLQFLPPPPEIALIDTAPPEPPTPVLTDSRPEESPPPPTTAQPQPQPTVVAPQKLLRNGPSEKTPAGARSAEAQDPPSSRFQQSGPTRPDFSLEPSPSTQNNANASSPAPMRRQPGSLPVGVPGLSGDPGARREQGSSNEFPGSSSQRPGAAGGEQGFLSTCAGWIDIQSSLIVQVEAFIKRTGANRCDRGGTRYIIDRSTSRTNLHISVIPPNKTSACEALDEFKKCIQ